MTGPTFYHYTCDHGREALGDAGTLLPAADLTPRLRRLGLLPALWVWCTDLATPNREGLGLTMNVVTCDRTAHRYRVVQPGALMRWAHVARTLTREQRDALEAEPGAMPAHWYVGQSVDVVYDPVVP